MESRDARSPLRAASGCVIPRSLVNESLPGSRHLLEMTHSCGRRAHPFGCLSQLPARPEKSYGVFPKPGPLRKNAIVINLSSFILSRARDSPKSCSIYLDLVKSTAGRFAPVTDQLPEHFAIRDGSALPVLTSRSRDILDLDLSESTCRARDLTKSSSIYVDLVKSTAGPFAPGTDQRWSKQWEVPGGSAWYASCATPKKNTNSSQPLRNVLSQIRRYKPYVIATAVDLVIGVRRDADYRNVVAIDRSFTARR
jgi:hypothetical protein